MTVGAGGKLLTCQYESSIFQALSSRSVLPCGLRVSVIHSGSLQYSHSTFITYGVPACTNTCMPTHLHTNTNGEVAVIKVFCCASIWPLPGGSAALLSLSLSNVSKSELNCKINCILFSNLPQHSSIQPSLFLVQFC